jgi:DNA mismatch repair protein MutL
MISMGQIRILSEQIANKIAAGEVIERPGSVVKELIENSIDAQAVTISVWVSHGGKSLIKVTDDGCGMDRDDAQNCLLRHATSKISSAEDIEQIHTLGFRGEALPSIAAVSRLTLITKPQGATTGTTLKATAGIVESVKESTSSGTSIEVADLFFNTPARKKFLKSDGAEYAAIAEVFDTMALSYPNISFYLYKSGTATGQYQAGEHLLQRIEQIYSPDIAKHLHPLPTENRDISISGYIGTPQLTRVNRSGQKFFINRRPVRSIALSIAVERAYEEMLERGRHPVAILFFEIDPALVDVNIHPAKREVRILNERFLQDILIKAIRKTFSEKGIFITTAMQQHVRYAPVETARSDHVAALSFSEIREAAARWDTPAAVKTGQETTYHVTEKDIPALVREETFAPEEPNNPFGIIRVLGQVKGTYLLAETADGLALIDQHAAHERIMYEQILDAISEQPTSSQRLLLPITLHLDLKERSMMEHCLPDLHKTGFGINNLGGGTFSVDAIPAFLSEEDCSLLLKDTLHELMEESLSSSTEKREQAIAAALACKTRTVKAGKILNPPEIAHLIQQLGSAQNPHTCPHGRPTMFSITTCEIEKRFKRR